MKKIDHEKLAKKTKVQKNGHEYGELPQSGSSADQKRYIDEKYGGSENKPSNINKFHETTCVERYPKGISRIVIEKGAKYTNYTLSGRYILNDYIKHELFGKGKVIVVENDTITVFFRNSTRKLAHNKKNVA